MSWARLDDGYAEHPKIKRAWRLHPRAVGLFSMAISHAARYETDGRVDVEWLEEKVPSRREREGVLSALLDVGLFEYADGGELHVHDFLDYNRSKARATEDRAKTAERQRRFQARRRHGVTHAVSNAVSNGTPDPTRPDLPPAPKGEPGKGSR